MYTSSFGGSLILLNFVGTSGHGGRGGLGVPDGGGVCPTDPQETGVLQVGKKSKQEKSGMRLSSC